MKETISNLNCKGFSSYLFELCNQSFNKMRRCTVYANRIYFVTFIYRIEALLEALSRWCILTIYGAKADPGWNLDVFFFEQLHTGLHFLDQNGGEVKIDWKHDHKEDRKPSKNNRNNCPGMLMTIISNITFSSIS